MDEIIQHLDELDYKSYGVEHLNIPAELYLRETFKKIFNNTTELRGKNILLELEYHFGRDKIIKNLSKAINYMFPNIKSYQENNCYLSFELETGTFVRFSTTKYEDSSIEKLVWARFLDQNKFKPKQLK